MKKLVISENVINGKLSNAEVLMNFVFQDETDFAMRNFGLKYKEKMTNTSDFVIEEIADDLGYFENSEGLEKAKMRLNNLAKFIQAMIFRIYKSDDKLYQLINVLPCSTGDKIKLTLYCFVFHKRKDLVARKINSLINYDINTLKTTIHDIVNSSGDSDYVTIRTNVLKEIKDWRISYYIWYYGNIGSIEDLIKSYMSEKIHGKNKVKL